MNITLTIIDKDGKESQMTFFEIVAISKDSKNPEKSIIHTNGDKFLCTLSFGELWDKLKNIKG
jgi:hypothetical protein